jgi:hypothetical protein
MIKTKKRFNIFAESSKKTAASRRLPDGSYKGMDKTHETKLKNNSYVTGAQKIAKARRMPDGTYKGALKSIINRKTGKGRRFSYFCKYTKKDGTEIIMRSTWEWSFAYMLDLKNLNWRYESEPIVEGGHYYIPDFWVDGLGLVEIKPERYLSELKEDLIKKYNIIVITEKNQEWPIKKYSNLAKKYIIDQKDTNG